MWAPEQILHSYISTRWTMRVVKDDNGGGEELIWIFLGSNSGKTNYSIFSPRNYKHEIQFKKAFDKLVIVLNKMNDCSGKRVKPAIDKILKELTYS